MNDTIESSNSIDSTMADIFAVTRDGKEIKVESVEYEIVVERTPIYGRGFIGGPIDYTSRNRRLTTTIYLSSSAFRSLMDTQDFFNIHIRMHGQKYEVIIRN